MISLPGILWGCTGSLDMLGYEETKSPTSPQETVLFKKFVGCQPSLGVSRQNIRIKIRGWMDNQHLASWRGLGSTVYRVSQEERTKLREGVPYVKLYRYNPKHLYPKLNGYGDNGKRSLKL